MKMINRLSLFLALISLSKGLIAEEFQLGVNLGYGYIPWAASPLEKGSYGYSGIYIGTKEKKFDIGIMDDSSDCNNNSRKVSYSQYSSVKTQKLLWGVEYLSIDRKRDLGCNVGAVISLPLPFIGYRHEIKDGNIKVNTELQLHTYGVGVSINTGF